MLIRLTTIALRVSGGREHPIGAELLVGVQIDADLAQKRLDAGTAEIVGDAPSPEILDLAAAYRDAFLAMQTAAIALWAASEAGSLADARVVVEAMKGEIDPAFKGQFERVERIEARVEEADREAVEALRQQNEADGGGADAHLDASTETAPNPPPHIEGGPPTEIVAETQPPAAPPAAPKPAAKKRAPKAGKANA